MRLKWDRYSIYGLIFALPAFIFYLLVFFYPLMLGFWNSLHDINILGHTYTWVGLKKFIRIFQSGDFRHSVKVTFLYVIMVVPALMVLSLAVSNLIVNLKRAISIQIATTLFFLPLITSMVSAGIVWEWILDPNLGVVNNVIGALGIPHQLKWLRSQSTALMSVAIIGIWIRLGFDVIIFVAGLDGIPQSYYEAAEIDGASPLNRFFRITVPLLNPQIVMVLTLELIFAFKAFDQIYVTTVGGPAAATKTVMVYMLKDVFSRDYGEASAITVTTLAFLFLISFLQRRFLRRSVEY